jgi:hypothetical protein
VLRDRKYTFSLFILNLWNDLKNLFSIHFLYLNAMYIPGTLYKIVYSKTTTQQEEYFAL